MEIPQYWIISILIYPAIFKQHDRGIIWYLIHHSSWTGIKSVICLNHSIIASLHRVASLSVQMLQRWTRAWCGSHSPSTSTRSARDHRGKRVDPPPIQTLVLRCERRVRSGHSHAARVLHSAAATRFPHGTIRATHRTRADVSLASSRSIIDSFW